ncbi:hypothetical protein GA0115237_11391, partial [Streptomyces sp. ScaeMP-6W]
MPLPGRVRENGGRMSTQARRPDVPPPPARRPEEPAPRATAPTPPRPTAPPRPAAPPARPEADDA